MGDCLNSVAPSANNAHSSFIPLPLELDSMLRGGSLDGKQLLEKAIENLSWKRTKWLKTRIRQTMKHGESTFFAEASLLRGPNQCSRFELSVLTSGASSRGRLLVVSDGQTVAEVRDIGETNAAIACAPLPTLNAATWERDVMAREVLLAGKGCGGPLTLLQELHARLDNLSVQTGLLRARPVLQIQGDFPQGENSAAHSTAIAVRSCTLYLDAGTLLPQRMEWWSVENAYAVLQIDFHDTSLNQELSVEECERAFSYEPKQAVTD